MSEWSIYVLASTVANRTYVGYTRTAKILSRLSKHNGARAGGANATRAHRPWQVVLSVDGLERRPAMQLEWRMHRRYAGRGASSSIGRRMQQLAAALSMERWTSTAPALQSLASLRVTWHCAAVDKPVCLAKWLEPPKEIVSDKNDRTS